jgi:hypothetical protein
MSNSATRYELLEELARLALKCRHMIPGTSPEAARFQEVVDRLCVRPPAELDDDVVGLLRAIERGPDGNRQSLYWQAAALIPI